MNRELVSRLYVIAILLQGGLTFAQEEGQEPVADDQLDELLDEAPAARQDAPRKTLTQEDLTPYFAADEALAKAKWLYDHRQFKASRKMLAALGDSNPVRYLWALSMIGAGDVANGAEELEALAESYPAMRDYALFEAAKGWERLRKLPKAKDVYAQVSPSSLLFADARFAMARVLKRMARYDEGMAALEPLRELPDGPRTSSIRLTAILTACDLARWKADYNAEHRALLEVWATAPFSRQAEVARRRLEGLPVPGKWKVRRAEALVAAHHNLEGMQLAEDALAKNPMPSPIGCRAGYVLGNALRKERQHRRAIAALRPVVEACPMPDLKPQALFVMGYSQSVVEKEQAAATYEALAAEFPQHPLADDALFFAARMHARAGELDTALSHLATLRQQYRDSNFAAEALFKTAWIYKARGDKAGALAALDELLLLDGSAGDREILRARYWKARLSDDQDLYERLARERPTTYYGQLAARRLVASVDLAPATNEATSVCAPEETWPLELGPLQNDPHFTTGLELIRLGLGNPAQELLAVNRKGQPDYAMRTLHEVLEQLGHRRTAKAVLKSALGAQLKGPIEPSSRELWESMYPLSFRRQIERFSRPHRVDPNLLQALIREESRFNPFARSSTGARGLAQLMPPTAQRVAASLGLGPVTPGALHEPSLNVRLGAAYLGSLVRQFDGQLERAVASYNAGPGAVNKWMQAWPEADIDEWVEEIPIDETRDYVKKVLGSYYAYQQLYTGAPAVRKSAKSQQQLTAKCQVATPPVSQREAL